MVAPAFMCYALLRMRPLSISCAEGFVVVSCGKVDYDKSGWRDDCVRISVRICFILSERLIDAISILPCELEACYALLRMRPLSISWAECSVVISCGKFYYDKSG
jgi:hypothetical protein